MSLESNEPLFARHLREDWALLPDPIRRMHAVANESIASGRCSIQRGPHLLSRWIASLFRFPEAGDDVPVTVRFNADSGGERWTRSFAGRVLTTHFTLGRHLINERFGVVEFGQILSLEGDRLYFHLRRWSALGIPLPLWLAPRSNSYETVEGGRFRFHVEINLPLLGLLVRYSGWLDPNAQTV